MRLQFADGSHSSLRLEGYPWYGPTFQLEGLSGAEPGPVPASIANSSMLRCFQPDIRNKPHTASALHRVAALQVPAKLKDLARGMIMQSSWTKIGLLLVCAMACSVPAHAQERLALLIGNQNYSDQVGRLKNPHADIDLVGAALTKVGFKITAIKDADYATMLKAAKTFASQVRDAGPVPSASSTIRAMVPPIQRRRSITSSQSTRHPRKILPCGTILWS